jgi:hypothetical protein
VIFTRGVPLVPSVARIVQLTGAQDLRNLEASGELKLDDLLVTASDGVFDRLVADGLDPALLTNPEVYERAVAYTFLAVLAAQSYLDGQEDAATVSQRHFALADRFYEQVKPRLAGGQAPRTATEGVPVVRNPPGIAP